MPFVTIECREVKVMTSINFLVRPTLAVKLCIGNDNPLNTYGRRR